jgi:hypothetical protein
VFVGHFQASFDLGRQFACPSGDYGRGFDVLARSEPKPDGLQLGTAFIRFRNNPDFGYIAAAYDLNLPAVGDPFAVNPYFVASNGAANVALDEAYIERTTSEDESE